MHGTYLAQTRSRSSIVGKSAILQKLVIISLASFSELSSNEGSLQFDKKKRDDINLIKVTIGQTLLKLLWSHAKIILTEKENCFVYYPEPLKSYSRNQILLRLSHLCGHLGHLHLTPSHHLHVLAHDL